MIFFKKYFKGIYNNFLDLIPFKQIHRVKKQCMAIILGTILHFYILYFARETK